MAQPAKTKVRVKDMGNDSQKVFGFYRNRRYSVIGEEFFLERPKHFSGKYMEYVSGPKPPVIVRREEEARAEDEEIAHMRRRQAEGDTGEPEYTLDEDEIEVDNPEAVEVEVEVEDETKAPVKKKQPQNAAAKKKAAANK